jgi:excisionase family DNA binding protein
MRQLLHAPRKVCNSYGVNEALMSTAQAAVMLGVDPATITRWVRQGRLAPAFKGPGRTGGFMFYRTDVERLARQRGTMAG